MSAVLHQGLFTVIALVAIAELSLTAFLISKGLDTDMAQSQKFHDLLIFTTVVSVWTTFFGLMYAYWIISQALHFLASVATSIWWLCVTSLLWGISAGLLHTTRSGGICDGLPPVSRCRQSLTAEALGWVEFSLCLATVFATWIWVSSEDDMASWRGSWYGSPQVRTQPMRQSHATHSHATHSHASQSHATQEVPS